MTESQTGQARSKIAGARRLLGEIYIHQLTREDIDKIRELQYMLNIFEDELSMRQETDPFEEEVQ